MRKLLLAPFDLHERLLELIQRETENAKRGLPARIMAKLNSLADQEVIEALYAASQAGVRIDLIVRGICCLRPGITGLSGNISVRSIVDRFLEHSRIYYFENACQPRVFVSSADWLPRNFYRRIEVAVPIENGILRERVIREFLGTALADNRKARFLQPDGSYRLAVAKQGERSVRSQVEFIELARASQDTEPKTTRGTTKYPRVQVKRSPSAMGKGDKA